MVPARSSSYPAVKLLAHAQRRRLTPAAALAGGDGITRARARTHASILAPRRVTNTASIKYSREVLRICAHFAMPPSSSSKRLMKYACARSHAIRKI